jgi:hypothetical protein
LLLGQSPLQAMRTNPEPDLTLLFHM